MAQAVPWALKMGRARQHIDSLGRRIGQFQLAHPCGLKQVDLPGGSVGLVLHAPNEPPAELALMVGDALHNIRSALDTRFIAAVAEAVGHELTEAEARPLGLPTVSTPRQLEDRLRSLPHKTLKSIRIADAAFKLARSVQGFAAPSAYWAERHGSEANDPSDAATQRRLGEVLRHLAALSNRDKHRGLHLAWWTSNDVFAATDGREVTWTVQRGPWRDGDIVVRLTADRPGPAFAASLQGTVVLGLPATPAFAGLDLVGQLNDLHWWAARALELLTFEVAHPPAATHPS